MVRTARYSNPFNYLSSVCPDVRLSRNGHHIVVDDILRADIKQNGIWIACDWYGGGIGDPIAMVRHLSNSSFVEAVSTLLGHHVAFTDHIEHTPDLVLSRPKKPKLVSSAAGREYLVGRGISIATIQEAERQNMLRYSRYGVLFVGRDETNDVRLINIRFYKPLPPDGLRKKELSKMDMEGSNKSYPVILKGESDVMGIVEGGVNVLAARDMLTSQGYPCATVMATGGVGVRGFLNNPYVTRLITSTPNIFFFWENEVTNGVPNAEKQMKTDKLRNALLNSIQSLRDADDISIICPPDGFKDVADWNQAENFASFPKI